MTRIVMSCMHPNSTYLRVSMMNISEHKKKIEYPNTGERAKLGIMKIQI